MGAIGGGLDDGSLDKQRQQAPGQHDYPGCPGRGQKGEGLRRMNNGEPAQGGPFFGSELYFIP